VAQQIDITRLKQERDDTISRIEKLEENLPKRYDDLANRIEQNKDILEVLQPVLDQLAALEGRPLESELPSPRNELEKLKSVLSRLDAVEASQREMALPSLRMDVEQLKPVLGRLDALEKSTPQKQSVVPKPLSDRVDGIEAASSKAAKDVQNALEQTKNANRTVELQEIDITTLRSWKDDLPKVFDEEAMKQLVLQEVLNRTDEAKKVLRTEAKVVETRLATRITEEQKKVTQLQTNMTASLAFKETIEKQKLDGRLTDLTSKLREVEANDSRTYKKTTRLEDLLDDLDKDTRQLEKDKRKLEEDSRTFDKDIDKLFATGKKADEALNDLKKDIEEYIGPVQEVYDRTGLTLMERLAVLATKVGQVPHHQSELARLSSSQTVITAELNKLSARLDVLEKVVSNPTAAPSPGPGFKKVEKPVASSSSPKTNDNFTDITNQRMGQLDKDIKELRQALEEVKGLDAKLERLDARLAVSEERTTTDASERQTLGSNLTELDTRLSKKMQSLTTAIGDRLSTVEKGVESMNDASGNTGTRLLDIEACVESLKATSGSTSHPTIQSDPSTITQDINDLRGDLDQFDTGLTEAEKTIHQHGIEIDALQNNLTSLFKENFDPFKHIVEEQLGTINSKLEAYGVDVKGLREHVSRAQPRQSGFGETQRTQLQSLAQDAVNLKAVVDGLQKALQAETDARGRELCTKGDAQIIKNQMEAFNYSLNHLESRYENITTDEVYQRMVHWFSQTYPNATALTNYPQIQQDVNQLKAFQRQVSWMQNYSQDLNGIFQNAQQLRSLISNAPQLHDLLTKLPQLQALVTSHSELSATLMKVEQACTDAKTAIAKSDQAELHVDQQLKTIESIKTAINGLQTSYRSLNSPDSPFVRTDALNRMESTIQTLKDQIGEEKNERVGSPNGLRTTFGEEHNTRVKVEEQLRSSINELKRMKTELEPKVTQIAEQFSQVQASSSQLRQDFDTMKNTLVEPNREFLGSLGTMFVVVAQIQSVIDSLNRNLPVALKYDWECYFPTLGQPETNGDDATKGKGKGKSKQ
jgi:chromosome segregation ATPase